MPFDSDSTGTNAPCDFTAHRHPVLAVACPDCGAMVGVWCKRPSGHRAQSFHRARAVEADTVFIAQHGEYASIERTNDGWRIEPNARTVPENLELPL